MTKKRYGVYNYSSLDLSQLIDNSTNELFGIVDAVDLLNKYNVGYNQCHSDVLRLEKENEELKQKLSDIRGQLVMLDNCDNWDYTRMKYTVREIAEIMGYNGTINPKMIK